MDMIFGITGNTTKGMIKGVIPELIQWLEQHNCSFILDVDLLNSLSLDSLVKSARLNEIGQMCDMVLAFGGDGTILATARVVGASGVPILGVNLGGKLGFLAEVMIEDLYHCLNDVLRGEYLVLERLVLETRISQSSGEKISYALNDVVIDRGGYSRVIRIDVYIDEEYLNTYLGDGIIIATPTGSTAYSLSAYGPILVPTLNCIIINPICPHSLGVRPIVIPDHCEIRVVPHLEGKIVTLSVDGQVSHQFTKNEGAAIFIHKANYKVKWIRAKNRTFYDLLRAKLNWGVDRRTV
ncbi:MAG: NAD(+)/NADH kinase [candidate division KSB1 bacterium]|nr:NAD(+)/NADH kinase [candidate division KSB1 bacterium]MDZ7399155.1 NAD(+)/NADH kinase [candidate division KSB1 bacterium]